MCVSMCEGVCGRVTVYANLSVIVCVRIYVRVCLWACE